MANPPITIGPFNNVPAPGSPIKSDWPQEISTVATALAMSLSKADYQNATPTTGALSLSTTPLSIGSIALASVPYRSLIVAQGAVTVAASTLGTLTYADLSLDVGVARRNRIYSGGTNRVVAFALLAASTALTVTLTIAANATGTLTTSGGGDLNTLQVVRIPVPETPT